MKKSYQKNFKIRLVFTALLILGILNVQAQPANTRPLIKYAINNYSTIAKAASDCDTCLPLVGKPLAQFRPIPFPLSAAANLLPGVDINEIPGLAAPNFLGGGSPEIKGLVKEVAGMKDATATSILGQSDVLYFKSGAQGVAVSNSGKIYTSSLTIPAGPGRRDRNPQTVNGFFSFKSEPAILPSFNSRSQEAFTPSPTKILFQDVERDNYNLEIEYFALDPTNENIVYAAFQNEVNLSKKLARKNRAGDWVELERFIPGGLSLPNSVWGALAVDKDGNLYVADETHHVIVKATFDANGKVSSWKIIGGKMDTPGFVNDNNPLNSRFNKPSGICIDLAGNIYVGDAGNNVIRKIDDDGEVTTYAGSGQAGADDDDDWDDAAFRGPTAVAYNEITESLYVVDFGNKTIREINEDREVSTLAGIAGSLNPITDPTGFAMNFYYVLAQLNMDPDEAKFANPTGIAIDPSGLGLYVSDGQYIKYVNTSETIFTITAAFGDPKANVAGIPILPLGISMNKNNGSFYGVALVPWEPTTYTISVTNHVVAGSIIPIIPNGAITFEVVACPTTPDTVIVNQTILLNQLPYTWNGKVLNGAGRETVTLRGMLGCDSVVTLNLSINPEINYNSEPYLLSLGQQITPIVPTTAGSQVDVYSISPPLSAGLMLNTQTGIITGTPTTPTTSLLPAVGPRTPPQYPAPWTLVAGEGADITGFKISDGNQRTVFENNSAFKSLAGTAGQGTGTPGAYTDFSGLGAIKLFGNSPYTVRLSNALFTPGREYENLNYTRYARETFDFKNSFAVYIDYNRDGDFADAGERVYISGSPETDAHAESFSLNIPLSAAPGVTKMRIYAVEAKTAFQLYLLDNGNGGYNSVYRTTEQALSFYPFFNNISYDGETYFTYNMDYGEFEDYNIDIVNIATQSYVVTGSNQVGTDQSTIKLAINVPTTSTNNVTICSTELPYNWNGLTFSQAGTQTAHLTNISGADSAATLILTVKQATSSLVAVANCGPYTYLGKEYTTSGDYYVHILNAVGCDSAITFRFRQKANGSTTTVELLPNALPYRWNNLNFSNSGIYSVKLPNLEGCDSTATLILRVQFNVYYPATNTLEINKAIQPIIPQIEGNYVPAADNPNYGCYISPNLPNGLQLDINTGVISGTPTQLSAYTTYTVTRQQQGSIPSTFTLSVGQPTFSTTTVDNCGPFTWNGVVYTTAGTISATFKNQYGFDSTATLILSIRNLSASTTNLNLNLSELPVIWNGDSITREGLHTVYLVNAVGCDSAATADVVISPKILYVSPQILHPNQTIAAITPQILGGKILNYTILPSLVTGLQFDALTGTISGTPADTLLQPVTYTVQAFNRAGTDTTTLVIAVCNPMATSFTQIACDRYVWNDSSYTSSTTHTRTLKNRGDCDSVVTMHLTIKKSSTGPTTTATACGSYLWHDIAYDSTGVYTKVYKNAVDCDSTIYLNLTIKKLSYHNRYVNLNQSDFPYTWRGLTFSAPGTQSIILENSVGCDSVLSMTVRISSVLPDISYASRDTILYWEKTINPPIAMANTGTPVPALKLGERDTLIRFSNGPGDHIKTIKSPNGVYYARVFGNSNIFKLTSAGSWSVFAGFGGAVKGMVMDTSGNLYVAIQETGSEVRKITPAGEVSTVPGFKTFSGIDALALDPEGNLIIHTQFSQQIIITRLNLTSSQYVQQNLDNTPYFDTDPEDFKTDSKGNIYMYRNVGNNVVKIRPDGHMSGIGKNTVWVDEYVPGNGIDATIPTITSMAIDPANDNVYVMANGNLHRIDTSENVTVLTGLRRTFDQFKDQIFRVENGKVSIVNSSTGVLFTVNVYGVGSIPFMDNYGVNGVPDPQNATAVNFKDFDKRIRIDSSGAIVGTPRARYSSIGVRYADNRTTSYSIVAANQYGISTAPMVITTKGLSYKRESFLTTSLPFVWRGRSFNAATDSATYLVTNKTQADDTLYMLHLVYEAPPEPLITSNCGTNGVSLTANGAAKNTIRFDGTNTGLIKNTDGRGGGGLAYYGADWTTRPDGSTIVYFRSAFEVWIKPSTVTGTQYLLTRDTVKTHGTFFGFSLQNGKFVYEFTKGSAPFVDYKLVSDSNILANVWTHVAASYYDSAMHIFINGKPAGRLQTADRFLNPFYSAPDGAGVFPDFSLAGLGSQLGYKGEMDELRLWATRRTADSIKATMNTIVNPSSPGLGLYYRFDGAVSTGISDVTSSGRIATLIKPAISVTPSGAPINFASYKWTPGGDTTKSIVVNAATNTVYTVTVKDYKGASGSDSLLVYPSQGPAITAPAAVTRTSGSSSCTVFVSDAELGAALATDNCSGVTVERTGLPAGNLFPVGVTTITYTATNAGGLTKTATQTVTVTDTVKPTITCNAPIRVNNDPGVCGARVNYTVISSDNCTGQSVAQTAGLASGSLFPAGTTTNTFVVIDASGNTATCSFTVTVADTEKPTITCNAPISVNNDPGVCGARVNYTVTSADNCSGQSVAQTAGLASGSLFPVGTTTNTFVVTDASGNTATCSFTVIVTDNEKPVLTCPGIQKFCSVPAGSYTIPMLTASDNCGIQTVAYAITGATTRSGTGYNASGAFAFGTNTITWTVTDINGNTNTCTTTIVVSPLPVASITTSTPNDFCNVFTLTAHSTLAGPFTYTWKFNNTNFAIADAIDLGNANGDGDYSVYATDGNGCQSTVPAVYNYKKQNIVNNYTILANKEVKLDDYNKVLSGSVGIMQRNGEAEFGRYSSVAGPGAFVKSPDIDVDNPVTIPIRIYAVATVILPVMQVNTSNTNSLPSYTVNQYVTVTLNGNYKNLTIRKGANVTLNGTVFGSIRIEEGAAVRFTSTVINIGDLTVGKGPNNGFTKVWFSDNTAARISKFVKVEEDCVINPDGIKLTFYLGDTKCDEEKFEVKGGNTTVTANIYAPGGKIKVTGGSNCHNHTNGGTINMNGLFIADEVESKGKYVTWNSYDCNSTAAPIASFAENQEQSLAVALTPVDVLKVTAFPNPSPRYFTLLVKGKNNEPVSIRVSDILGRLVEERKGVSANGTLTLGASYRPGLYMAEVSQGKQKVVLKLMKQSE